MEIEEMEDKKSKDDVQDLLDKYLNELRWAFLSIGSPMQGANFMFDELKRYLSVIPIKRKQIPDALVQELIGYEKLYLDGIKHIKDLKNEISKLEDSDGSK